eukprot:XP_006577394.1 glycine-rich protein DOT1-like [Glycine max]
MATEIYPELSVLVYMQTEEVGVGGNVVVRSELIQGAFPGGEVDGVLIAVLPGTAPGGEDGGGIFGADVLGGGEAAEEEGAEHKGVGGRGEGVELGGDVGVGGDEEGVGIGIWGCGRGRVGGGGGGGEEEREGGGGGVAGERGVVRG